MRNGRRLLAASVVAALGLTAAACGDDDDEPSVTGTETTGGADTTATTGGDTTPMTGDTTAPTGDTTATTEDLGSIPEGYKVAVLFDVTGRGDKSFNDAAAAGLDQAEADFGVDPIESTPSGDADRAARLDTAVQGGNELVVAVGYLWTDTVAQAAPSNPETNFAIVDSVVEEDNVASLVFAEEQGSFLVGAAAALKSQTGKIGFVGGVPNDLIKKFEAGYVAGARHIDPDIELLVEYISEDPTIGFNNDDRGEELASAMYEDEADIVYHAAGASGSGVFEAAAGAGEAGEVWAIGVDSDQYQAVDARLQPYILTSMLKRVDVAVYETAKAAASGNFQGGVQVFDLSVDGVGYATSGGFVDDIAGQLDELKQQIIDGEIEVPTAPEE